MSKAIENIIKEIKKLEGKLERELNISEDDLNTLLTEQEEDNLESYDSSERYRKQIISQGYRIHKMIAVYYQGWECDFWSFIVSKDGKKYKAESSHGGWGFTEL